MFEFSVSVDDIIQHHHPKYSVLSCFCTQHSAFNECPCFCLLTIHPLIALSPGVNIYLILTPAVMILQFPATTNSAAVNIFPWDSCEDLSGIQTTIFLLQLSMCSLWNRKPVHLVIFFFVKKLDYCNHSLGVGWSPGGTQIWIYRKQEHLYLSSNYFIIFPLYSTYVPWGIRPKLMQGWLRFLAPCIVRWPGLGFEPHECED